MYSTHYGAVIH